MKILSIFFYVFLLTICSLLSSGYAQDVPFLDGIVDLGNSELPLAEYDALSNRTFVVYPGCEGGIDPCSCDPYIIYYDHNFEQWSQPLKLGDSPPYHDSHYYPQIIIDNEHYIHVFNGGHADPIQHFKSVVKTDDENIHLIQSWQQVPFSNTVNQDRATYLVALETKSDDMYLFYRQTSIWINDPHEPGEPDWYEPYYYIKSTDNGNTWSLPVKLIDPGCDADEWNTIYRKAIYYQEDQDRFHITFAHTYHHNDLRDKIYYAYLDLQTDQIHTPTGYNAGSTLERAEFENPIYQCMIWQEDSPTTPKYHSMTMNCDTQGHVNIIFCPTTYGLTNAYQKIWNGSAWEPDVVLFENPLDLLGVFSINFYDNGSFDLYARYLTQNQTLNYLSKFHFDGQSRQESVLTTRQRLSEKMNVFCHFNWVRNGHKDFKATFKYGGYSSWQDPEPNGQLYAWGEEGIIPPDGLPLSYDIHVNLVGRGVVKSDPSGIQCGDDCSETVWPGMMSLYAQPDFGYSFLYWQGLDIPLEDNPLVLNPDKDLNLSAHFVPLISGEPFIENTSETISRNASQISQGVYDAYSNKTFIVFPGCSGSTSDPCSCDPYLIYYDHTTSTWSPSVRLGLSPPLHDSHYFPQIIIDNQRHIHVFNSGHTDPIQHFKSTVKTDHNEILNTANWQEIPFTNTDNQNRASYVYAIQTTNNDIYLFYRQTVYSSFLPGPLGNSIWYEPIYYIKSIDNGNTWSLPKLAIDPIYDLANWNTIYIKGLFYSRDANKLHITFGNHYNHNEFIDKLYYICFDFELEQLYSPTRFNLGTTVNELEFDDPEMECVIHSDGGQYWRYVYGVTGTDNSGIPHVFYNVEMPDGKMYIKHRMWQTSKWSNPEPLFKNDPTNVMPLDVYFGKNSCELYTAHYMSDLSYIKICEHYFGADTVENPIHSMLDPGISRFGHFAFIQNAHQDLKATFMHGEYHDWQHPLPVGSWYAWGQNGIVSGDNFSDQVTLSVQIEGQGTVECESPIFNCSQFCSQNVDIGSRVLLYAKPSQNYVFSHWSGAGRDSKSKQCDLQMLADKTVIAHFKPGSKAVTVNLAAIKFETSSSATPDLTNLLTKINDFMNENSSIDLIVTPEYNLSRYNGIDVGSPPIEFEYDDVTREYRIAAGQQNKRAVPIIEQILELVKSYHTNFVLGTIAESFQGFIYNSQLVINHEGEIIGIHRKTTEINPYPAPTHAKQYALDTVHSYTLKTQNNRYFDIFPLICSERTDSELLERANSFNADILAYCEREGDCQYEQLTEEIYNHAFDPSMHGWDWMIHDIFIQNYITDRDIICENGGYLLVSEGGYAYGGVINLNEHPTLPLQLSINPNRVYASVPLHSKVPVEYQFPVKGWYLISVPGTADDMTVSSMFAQTGATMAFKWENGQYEMTNILEIGKGYWIYVKQPCSETCNVYPAYTFSRHIESESWNLIGSVKGKVQIEQIQQNPANSLLLPLFKYDAEMHSYVTSTSIDSTDGYWIFADGKCNITVDQLGSGDFHRLSKNSNLIPPEPPTIDQNATIIPEKIKLHQNYPNPFNPVTRIRYDLPQAERVEIRVFNVKGERVQTLLDKDQPAGTHYVLWNPSQQKDKSLASGVYWVQMTAGQFTDYIKTVFIK